MATETLPHRRRVRGDRWLVFQFEGDDANWPLLVCRSETLARLRAGQFRRATYLRIPPAGAHNCAREGVPFDATTVSELARLGEVSPRAIREAVEREAF